MNKNDEITIKIEDLTDTGEGIGHAEAISNTYNSPPTRT